MQSVPSPPQGFTGTVNLQLTDLIQMVCLSRSDLIIRVRSGEGSGTIHVREGEIHHAQTETMQGESAFFEVLGWKDGQFEMLPFRDIGLNSIEKPWEHLLLETTRRRDERNKGGSRPNDMNQEPACDTPNCELDRNIDRVFDEFGLGSLDLEEEVQEVPEPSSHQLRSRIKALVVDDSIFFGRQLKKILEQDSDIEVVMTAKNGKEALDYLSSHQDVDLITLDIQMPVMKGDTTLKHIMIRYPIPTLILSSFEPQSLGKVLEFLQIGAIDFISKPDIKVDLAVYGKNLRDSVRKASQAKVSHFKRWRRTNSESPRQPSKGSSRKILIILGAEGAYMDWFRMPLSLLSCEALVIGLQNLPQEYLAPFCQLIGEGTGAKVEPLFHADEIRPGSVYLGNASDRVELQFDPEDLSMKMTHTGAMNLSWQEGIHLWLSSVADRAQAQMSVYCLSATHALPPDLIEKLIGSKARLILPPRNTVMCTGLVDSVEAYSQQHPQQIIWRSPDNIMEVF